MKKITPRKFIESTQNVKMQNTESKMASHTVFSPIEPPGGKAVLWGGCIRNNTKMTVSQPKLMVRFSFCKKGIEGKIVLYHLRI